MAETASKNDVAEGELLDPNVIIQHYQRLMGETQQIHAKLSEFEAELSEHQLVVNQLRPMNAGRKAYRLIGGVLVERTVGEVVPALEDNVEKLKNLIKQFVEMLERKEAETRAWKEKYQIRSRTADEIRRQAATTRGQRGEGSKQEAGVLA